MKRSTFRILFYIKRNNPKKNGNVVIMGRYKTVFEFAPKKGKGGKKGKSK